MTKINISDFFEKQNFSNSDLAYSYGINLLQDLKLIQGPQAVYSTLRRHKDFYSFLLSYQADHLKTIEGLIADLDE